MLPLLCRVLRQIVQCIKPIADVMVLLFFMVAIFALAGEMCHIAYLHITILQWPPYIDIHSLLSLSISLGYYLFADIDPTVCYTALLYSHHNLTRTIYYVTLMCNAIYSTFICYALIFTVFQQLSQVIC